MPGTGHSGRYKGSISNRNTKSAFQVLAPWNAKKNGEAGQVAISHGSNALTFAKLDAQQMTNYDPTTNTFTLDSNLTVNGDTVTQNLDVIQTATYHSDLNVLGNGYIAGNLTVDGSMTVLNIITFDVSDSIIEIGDCVLDASQNKSHGIIFSYNGDSTGPITDCSNGFFGIQRPVTPGGSSTGGTAGKFVYYTQDISGENAPPNSEHGVLKDINGNWVISPTLLGDALFNNLDLCGNLTGYGDFHIDAASLLIGTNVVTSAIVIGSSGTDLDISGATVDISGGITIIDAATTLQIGPVGSSIKIGNADAIIDISATDISMNATHDISMCAANDMLLCAQDISMNASSQINIDAASLLIGTDGVTGAIVIGSSGTDLDISGATVDISGGITIIDAATTLQIGPVGSSIKIGNSNANVDVNATDISMNATHDISMCAANDMLLCAQDISLNATSGSVNIGALSIIIDTSSVTLDASCAYIHMINGHVDISACQVTLSDSSGAYIDISNNNIDISGDDVTIQGGPATISLISNTINIGEAQSSASTIVMGTAATTTIDMQAGDISMNATSDISMNAVNIGTRATNDISMAAANDVSVTAANDISMNAVNIGARATTNILMAAANDVHIVGESSSAGAITLKTNTATTFGNETIVIRNFEGDRNPALGFNSINDDEAAIIMQAEEGGVYIDGSKRICIGTTHSKGIYLGYLDPTEPNGDVIVQGDLLAQRASNFIGDVSANLMSLHTLHLQNNFIVGTIGAGGNNWIEYGQGGKIGNGVITGGHNTVPTTEGSYSLLMDEEITWLTKTNGSDYTGTSGVQPAELGDAGGSLIVDGNMLFGAANGRSGVYDLGPKNVTYLNPTTNHRLLDMNCNDMSGIRILSFGKKPIGTWHSDGTNDLTAFWGGDLKDCSFGLIDLACGLMVDISGLHFCDASASSITAGNSLDVSSNAVHFFNRGSATNPGHGPNGHGGPGGTNNIQIDISGNLRVGGGTAAQDPLSNVVLDVSWNNQGQGLAAPQNSAVAIRTNRITDGAISIGATNGGGVDISGSSTTDGANESSGRASGAISISSTVGGMGLAWNDAKSLWAEGGKAVITANHDEADAIKLHASSGTTQTINVLNTAGTDNASIGLTSVAGGIDIDAAAGKDVDISGGQVLLGNKDNVVGAISLTTNVDTAETIVIHNKKGITEAAITLNAALGGIDIDAAAGKDVDISGGQVLLGNKDAVPGAISLTTNVDTGETIVIHNKQGITEAAITLNAALGGIDIDAAAGKDVDISGGQVLLGNKDAVPGAISLTTNVDTGETIVIHNKQGITEAAITLNAALGGIDIDAAAGKDVDISGGQVLLGNKDAVPGAISLTTNVDTGETIVIHNKQGITEAAITLNAALGGIDIDAAAGKDVDISGGQVLLGNKDAVPGAISLTTNVDTGETIVIHNKQGNTDGSQSAPGVAAGAINISTTDGGIGVSWNDAKDLWAEGGRAIVTANENAADAIKLHATPPGTLVTTTDALLPSITTNTAAITTGTQTGLPTTTSGSGIGAILTIVASGNTIVTGVTITTAGSGYAVGDTLTVAAANINGSATNLVFTLAVGDVPVGTSQTILIVNDEGTNAAAIGLTASAGGITLSSGISTDGSASGGALSLNAANGGINLIWNDAKDLWAEGGKAVITANEDDADCIKLHADAGTSQTISVLNDEGTNAAAIGLTASAGGITLDGAAGVNIAGNTSEVDITTTGTVEINAGQFDLFAGAGGVNIAGNAGFELDITTTGTVDINAGPLDIDATSSVTIDAGATSHFTTAAGALTLTSHEAATWSTTNGALTLASAAGVNINTGSPTTQTLVVTGNITATGSITSNQTSDIRFKTNLNKIENPLDKLSKINGYTFNWIESEAQNFFHGEDTGIVAQEVENLNLPGIVTTRDDGYKAVNYEKIVPLLIESIKSLQEQVSKLQEK